MSIPTLKDLCKSGRLPSFRTPGGHLRVPAEALAQLGQDPVSRAAVSSPLSIHRDRLEEKKLEIQELQLENDKEKLLAEKQAREKAAREVARTVNLRSQAKLAEVSLLQRRNAQEQEREQTQRERELWERRWIHGAGNEFPDWLSEEQENGVRAAVENALGQWDVGDSEDAIGKALDRVIERIVAPWRIERETVERRNRVLEVAMYSLTRGATATERTTAAKLVRVALNQVPLSATELEETTAAQGAIAELNQQIKERVEADAAQQLADREARAKKNTEEFNRMMRDQKKENSVKSGLGHIFWYVTRLENEEVIEDDEVDQDSLKAAIEPKLRETLSGDETTNEVTEFVEQLVDKELELT
jgi:hypothetical protein